MAAHNTNLTSALRSLVTRASGIWSLNACGITRSEAAIPALVHTDAYTPTILHTRVLFISGLSGRGEDMELAFQALNAYLDAGAPRTNAIALSAVPMANPDGLTLGVAPENGAGGYPATGYPPEDHFFDDPQNPERRYLWRWIGLQAPDVVVELRSGQTTSWDTSATALASALQNRPDTVRWPSGCPQHRRPQWSRFHSGTLLNHATRGVDHPTRALVGSAPGDAVAIAVSGPAQARRPARAFASRNRAFAR